MRAYICSSATVFIVIASFLRYLRQLQKKGYNEHLVHIQGVPELTDNTAMKGIIVHKK